METGRGRHQDKKRDQGKGFTLIEILFVMLLFPLLFFGIYTVMNMSQVIFRTNGAYAAVNQNAMQILRHIGREIGQTSPLVAPSHLTLSTDGSGNGVIQFQIPVDWDNDGDAVTAGMNPDVEWGAYQEAGQTQNGILNGWIEYRVLDNQLLRRVLNSGLSPIAGLERVVANDVQTFTASRSMDIVTTSITFSTSDTVGQNGVARNYGMTYTSRTLLRNSVN
ncbi:MAG: prepilin-type N-terminal cleavage/methylation domain-containing protein [Candidatus Omnitrophica bacterium]|nr:prepilin-type N-terminal cleavage/methylation domain-containing protein [Candidatus Omnitrophota bacterium]